MSKSFPSPPDLVECLRRLLDQVPKGRVTTCGELAEALGNKIAATWVGYYSLHHAHDGRCNCHRILRAGGALGGYIEEPIKNKIEKLQAEGVAVRRGTVDLERFGFNSFSSDRPLEKLRAIQKTIRAKIVVRPRRRIPKLVGGVDVSYPMPELGAAAYALVETESGRLVWSTSVRRRVSFPYISTFLSFREIPILLELLDAVRSADRLADVLLVDGGGVLHHRRAGAASHLGVIASLPTVGVTKKLLCGAVDIDGMAPGESRPVLHQEKILGVALRPTSGSRRPIFISPGHRVDLEFSERLVRRLLTGRRLPEPLYWADRISRRKGRKKSARKI
ncbi:MAG: endonuclease V [Pirellulales bacterium]|nr:endonuclease V [Pirellulales bacterium]